MITYTMSFKFNFPKIVCIFCLLILHISCQNPDNKQNVKKIESSKPDGDLIAKIAFGSCSKQYEPQILWDEIIAENCNMWIWLGDNIYGDTEDMIQLKSQYDFQKANKEYQKLKEKTPIYGIWDDHDYGVNDGGKEFSKKDESRDLMLEFLDVPKENDVYNRVGGYQSYDLSINGLSIKLILLDSRYFRDQTIKVGKSYNPNLTGTILGPEQWKWFENELNNSKADINLVGNGIQVIAQDHRFEKWNNFPNERQKMLDLVTSSGASRVILLSGDRHLSELSMLKLGNMEYPLYDITSSGLTHSFTDYSNEVNQHRIGEVVPEKSYAVLEIYRKENQELQIVLNFKGDNNTLWETFNLF